MLRLHPARLPRLLRSLAMTNLGVPSSRVIARRAQARRGALSAQREEVPLGCNLAVPGRIVGKPSAKTQLPSRDCHVASLLAMTRQAAWWCTSAPMLLNVPLLGAH